MKNKDKIFSTISVNYTFALKRSYCRIKSIYLCFDSAKRNSFYRFFTLRWQCVSIFTMLICILFGTLLSTVVLCVARCCDAAFAAANFIGNEETFVVDSIVETQRALEGSRCRRWRDVVAKIVLPRA